MTSTADHETTEFFRINIFHSQIASLILKRLSTARVAKQSSRETLVDVQDLDRQIREWYDSLPSYYRSSPPFRSTRRPRVLREIHIRYIFFIHRSSLITIHSQFYHPWNRPAVDESDDFRVIAQRKTSMNIVASAARELIMATHGLPLSVSTPVW